MRKPRDYDAELLTLNERTRNLRNRKLVQYGELVSTITADTLSVELLAGVLLAAVDNKDAATREGWRRRGAAFFRGTREDGRRPGSNAGSEPTGDGTASPPARTPGAE